MLENTGGNNHSPKITPTTPAIGPEPAKMMKTLLFSNYSLPKPALPFVISTGGVMGLCPLKVMKNGFCSATTLNGSAALPFVISTGAPKERSGEISVWMLLPGNAFLVAEKFTEFRTCYG